MDRIERVARVAEDLRMPPDPASARPLQSCDRVIFLKGETVVDLGSSGGLDGFLAAAKIGPTGRAIGIDMTAEVVEREAGKPVELLLSGDE